MIWSWSALIIDSEHVLIEPSLYWKDRKSSLAAHYIEPARLATFPRYANNPAARAAISSIRQGLIDTGRSVGAKHIQIGRLYSPEQSYPVPKIGLLKTLKKRHDPHGLMNPGVLGLS